MLISGNTSGCVLKVAVGLCPVLRRGSSVSADDYQKCARLPIVTAMSIGHAQRDTHAFSKQIGIPHFVCFHPCLPLLTDPKVSCGTLGGMASWWLPPTLGMLSSFGLVQKATSV